MIEDTRDSQRLYAVFRNGNRVSDREYESESFAQTELDYWKNIIRRNPDGSKVTILPVYTREREQQ